MSTPSLDLKPLRRGVTHETQLVLREGVPVEVLRLAPPGDVALPGLDVVREGELLRALDAPGVPRPRLLEQGVWLGRAGLRFEYVAGERAAGWPGDALDVLLALHRAPVGDEVARAGGDRAPVGDEAARAGGDRAPVGDEVARAGGDRAPVGDEAARARGDRASLGAGLDGSAVARVAALRGRVDDAVLDALAGGAPACAVPTWTHGDFRPANLVVRDGRIAAVLDWEMAGVGDPARDLGIATMPDWGAWLDDDELLERYRAGGGQAIAPRRLRWWRCLGYAMVLGFLNARRDAGWAGGPALDAFTAGLARSFEEWRACR